MRIRVRLFAGLAEQAGFREVQLEVPSPATPLDAWQRLLAMAATVRLPRESLRVAVNLRYAGWATSLADGDEVAFIPPVAGGNGKDNTLPCDGADGDGGHLQMTGPVAVILTEAPLAPEAAVAHLIDPGAGAVAVFVGVVRAVTAGRRTQEILYEAYDPMARAEMQAIGEGIRARYPEAQIILAHRVGRLTPGEISLVIAVATPHRAEAFAALREATEALKHRVPIWKKERFEDGVEWVGMQG